MAGLLDTDVNFPAAPSPVAGLSQGLLTGLNASVMIQQEKDRRTMQQVQMKQMEAQQAQAKMEQGLALLKEGWVPKDYKLALFKQNIQPYFKSTGMNLPELAEWPDFGDEAAKEISDIIEKSKKMNKGKGLHPSEVQTMIGVALSKYEPQFQKRAEPVLAGLKAEQDAQEKAAEQALKERELALKDVPAGYRRRADGGLEAIPGGPAKASEGEKLSMAQNRVTGNLKQMKGLYMNLAKLGGIVDLRKSSVENIFRKASASGAGQATGAAFGTKVQSIRNQINSIRPLLIQEIRAASGMGAKGLDSEKELEFYLQAATDPKKDLQANLAALKVLDQAYGLGLMDTMTAVNPTTGERLESTDGGKTWTPKQ